MSSFNRKQFLNWQRRTTNLLGKAEELMSETLNELGEEDIMTDHLDNVLHMIQDTSNHIKLRLELKE